MEADEIVEAVVSQVVGARLATAAAAGVSHGGVRAIATAGTFSRDDARAIDADALFDLASVSKTYTAAVIAQLIAEGRLDPDAPVAEVLPVGSGPDAERITLRMLLTHTAGLPSDVFLWKEPHVPERERLLRVLSTPLQTAPGAEFRYSCTGYIAAGAIAETVTGRSLSDLVAARITSRLGAAATSYGPVPADLAVATEDESYIGRGLVRGEVHDELNWYLGGRVGNAGLFAPIDDVLRFAESFLDDGLLGPDGYPVMTRPSPIPDHAGGFAHSLGLRIGDASFMGAAPAIGHTGFTGTMWWAIPEKQLAVVLLTNRVHPHRDAVDISPTRRRFSDQALALVS
ncbi:serine hydrolase domain-containing protein [Microbacterium soli]|uniref:Serine hydrolase domain-containing protein n=1 Tax=Microbacterium soli TaxID=446075 RepID=A0ABP7MX44_9MICO